LGPVTGSQVSWPLHGLPSSQLFGDVVQEKVQSGWQPDPATLFPVPKSHASGGVTNPSPHVAAVHAPPTQIWPVPHAVPSLTGVPAEQVCVASSHVPPVTQASVVAQSRVGSLDTQLNLQSASHPSPLVELPSSHSSGASTTPSPHAGATQFMPTQNKPAPHDAPSASGLPGMHCFTVCPCTVAPTQVAVPVHGSFIGLQSASAVQSKAHML